MIDKNRLKSAIKKSACDVVKAVAVLSLIALAVWFYSAFFKIGVVLSIVLPLAWLISMNYRDC